MGDKRSALLARAERIPTTVLDDGLRNCGHPSQAVVPTIQALRWPVSRVAGWAYTVTGTKPDSGNPGPDYLKARAIDGMSADQIAVWGGGDVEGVCLFGDLLAAAMQVRGVRGVVVDGGVRDVDDIDDAGLPLFFRYRTPKASTGFWRVTDMAVPVHLPGTTETSVLVTPDDLVVADANGVVCIPRTAIEDVLQYAEDRFEEETATRSRILAGESVEDLMRETGRI